MSNDIPSYSLIGWQKPWLESAPLFDIDESETLALYFPGFFSFVQGCSTF